MEFKNRLKNISLIFAFALLAALGASACGSSELVDIADDSANVETDTVAPVVGEADPVEPPPGSGGGVRPGFNNILDQGTLVVDDGEEPQPPSGGGVGGGGLNEPKDKCVDADFGKQKKNNDGGITGTLDDLNANDCIII